MKGVFPYPSHVCLVKTFQVFRSCPLFFDVFCSVGHANTISQTDNSNKKATGKAPVAHIPLRTKLKALAGVAHTSVTKVGSLGDGVLSSLKCLLLLLLLLNEAEDVHGFGSNGY